LHSSSRDTPMSLPDNGSITAAQLMDHPGQTCLCAGVSSLAFQSNSEPNHAIIVTCATYLAAMRRNEWHPTSGSGQPAIVIKITSYPGVSQVISGCLTALFRQISLNRLLHRFFQFRPLKECCLRTAARRHVVPERIRLECRRTATYLDRMRHRAPPRRGRSIDWPSVDGQHARDRQRAAAATSSCARKVNRHNAIREG
jgi:hypothetical protein